MEGLKFIVADEAERGVSVIPTISISKGGVVVLSKPATKALAIVEKDAISMAKDISNKVYIAKSSGGMPKFQLKRRGKNSLGFSRPALVRTYGLKPIRYTIEEMPDKDKSSVPGSAITWFKLVEFPRVKKTKS